MLRRCLDEGLLSIDNTLAERLLRGIAALRRTVRFFGSNAGGEHVAIIYSIAETTSLDGRSFEIYTATALNRLTKGHLAGEINDLISLNLGPDAQAEAVS